MKTLLSFIKPDIKVISKNASTQIFNNIFIWNILFFIKKYFKI